MGTLRGAWLLTGIAALSGCGAANAEDPQSVLRAYGRALEDGRIDDAYRLLSDDAKRGTPIAAFQKLAKDSPEDVKELGRALGRPHSSVTVQATVTGAGGQELHLILEKGRWRVDAAAVDLYAQDTPRHAVQGFVRALERKRYDVVLRYVPDSHRDGLDAAKLKKSWEGDDKEEMEQVLTALKQALPSAAIEETGDRASLAYGAGTMLLVREKGSWKIEDFD
ncbi:MAG: hypothetical protein U0169_05755 [Polyangiaceae bacterium]